MKELLYIVWNPSLSIGPFRWYSLCWLIGLALAYYVVKVLYKEQKIKDELFDPLFIYCFLGILLGARLGHCIFYQPDYFLTSGKGFIEMFLPIHFMADGGWKFTGYEGLASHGGTLGLIIALWLYVKHTKLNIWQVLDNIAIATGTTACFIRLGNLMNSEIIGKVTDVPWAFVFERVDTLPRHPGQLYEAIAYGVLFVLMWWLHKKLPNKIGTGWFFGLCLTYIFTFRFFIEYTKEIQEAFEASLPLDMGQILSIPFVIIGLACMAGGKWMKRLMTVAAITMVSSNVQAGQSKEYYELFAKDDAKAFYDASNKLKEEMLEKGNRQGYYVYCINEVNYEIRLNNNGKAMKLADEVLKEMKENKDGRYDMIYKAMASIYENRGNYRMARHYVDQALKFVDRRDTVGVVGAYLGKANLEASVHPDTTLMYIDMLKPLCQKYPIHYGYALKIKAMACYFKGDMYSFYEVIDEYNVHKRENRTEDTSDDYIFQALHHVFEGNYQEAVDEIHKDKYYGNNVYRYDLLIQLYNLKEDKDMVIDMLQQKQNAIDSLNADLIYENLNEMNAEMDVAKTEEAAARARNYWLAAVIVLLIVVIALLQWRYLTRKKLEKELVDQNKELEVALLRAEEADRMKSSFIEHVSHEIRTPLNIITGFTQIITNPEYEVDERDRHRMLSDISRNTIEITNIVNELLEVAQDDSRQHYDKNDTIEINALCRKVLKNIEKLNDHHLALDFLSNLPDNATMRTNKEAVEKILTQLLDNALKFTEKGKVELNANVSPDQGMIRFIITDTGIGIEKKHQPHIFDKFFKADSFKQGFGLGLTMSKKMATLLDGSLHLDKDYKTGARFILTLPSA